MATSLDAFASDIVGARRHVLLQIPVLSRILALLTTRQLIATSRTCRCMWRDSLRYNTTSQLLIYVQPVKRRGLFWHRFACATVLPRFGALWSVACAHDASGGCDMAAIDNSALAVRGLLATAAKFGHAHTVERLLQSRHIVAIVDLCDTYRTDVLREAARRGHVGVVGAFVRHMRAVDIVAMSEEYGTIVTLSDVPSYCTAILDSSRPLTRVHAQMLRELMAHARAASQSRCKALPAELRVHLLDDEWESAQLAADMRRLLFPPLGDRFALGARTCAADRR